MPTHHHTVEHKNWLTEQQRVLLRVLFEENNATRAAAGLPLRTLPQFMARVKQVLAAERRGEN
jgi:hypothetical protein